MKRRGVADSSDPVNTVTLPGIGRGSAPQARPPLGIPDRGYLCEHTENRTRVGPRRFNPTSASGASSRDDRNYRKGRSRRDAAGAGGRARAHRSGTQPIYDPPAVWHRAQAASALRQQSGFCDFRSPGRLRARVGPRDFGPSGAHLQPGPWKCLRPRPRRGSGLSLGGGKQQPTGLPARGLSALACRLLERDAFGCR
jgi:hypothetical protein